MSYLDPQDESPRLVATVEDLYEQFDLNPFKRITDWLDDHPAATPAELRAEADSIHIELHSLKRDVCRGYSQYVVDSAVWDFDRLVEGLCDEVAWDRHLDSKRPVRGAWIVDDAEGWLEASEHGITLHISGGDHLPRLIRWKHVHHIRHAA